MRDVLITGGTGHVGLNLVARIQAHDEYNPQITTRRGSPEELLPPDVDTVRADITERDSLQSAARDCDHVVHLAAITGATNVHGPTQPERIFEAVNVDGTRNVRDVAAELGVRSVVFLSTQRSHPDVPATENESLYLETKRRADRLFCREDHPVRYSILHPSAVFGPRDYRLRRFDNFRNVESNVITVPPMYQPGNYNLVHVDEVVDAIVYRIENPSNGRDLINSRELRRRDIVTEIAEAADAIRSVPQIPYDDYVVPTLVKMLHRLGVSPIDPDDVGFQSGRTWRKLPPELTNRSPVEKIPWQDAIRDAYRWYKRVGLL